MTANFSSPNDFRGLFRDDVDARAVYSEAAGIAQIVPRAVAVPADAYDVATLVRWAAREGIPLVPRGSGSSMAGGAIGDGVIVDLSRLRTLDAVDVRRRTVRCGPDGTAWRKSLRWIFRNRPPMRGKGSVITQPALAAWLVS